MDIVIAVLSTLLLVTSVLAIRGVMAERELKKRNKTEGKIIYSCEEQLKALYGDLIDIKNVSEATLSAMVRQYNELMGSYITRDEVDDIPADTIERPEMQQHSQTDFYNTKVSPTYNEEIIHTNHNVNKLADLLREKSLERERNV